MEEPIPGRAVLYAADVNIDISTANSRGNGPTAQRAGLLLIRPNYEATSHARSMAERAVTDVSSWHLCDRLRQVKGSRFRPQSGSSRAAICLLYTSDAADDLLCVD